MKMNASIAGLDRSAACDDYSRETLHKAARNGDVFRATCGGLLLAIFLCSMVNVNRAQTSTNPIIEGVSVREVSVKNKVVSLTIEITGNNFGSNAADLTAVQLIDAKGGAVGTVTKKSLVSNNKIVVEAEAPLGTTIEVFRITTRGITVDSSGFKLSLKEPSPPPKISIFDIKHSTVSSPNSPIQTLFVTNDKGLFDSNPHRMSIEILPAGASNVLIRPGSNPNNLIVDFVAPDEFEVKDVVVTVYDSADLDNRQVVAISKPFEPKKPQADPNEPKISKVEVLFLQRNLGIGRVKIEGSGFGNYRRPTLTPEEFISSYGRLTAQPRTMPTAPNDWQAWNREIEQMVNVVLVPRNSSLRVQRSKILYIDDKMVDLYFEFTKIQGYSLAFRPASVALTIKKPGIKQLPVVKADGVEAVVAAPETYLASKEVGPKRDEDLTYEFTILDSNKANYEFGRGIADNFYVIKLSVVNRGDKKIFIPLASIQAEIDWAHGGLNSEIEFFEGQETQTPAPLEDVSAFFDAYQKQQGKRARLFNILDGVTTLGAALIPFFGPGFRDAHVALTGGLIPGLRQGIG
ncbi:MAG TPA: hypothetical protein VE842_14760, partial [Pyrinomonadaceae bacterium]|nr:hypothetical protein [Pyrinomonadaceae bacterium]